MFVLEMSAGFWQPENSCGLADLGWWIHSVCLLIVWIWRCAGAKSQDAAFQPKCMKNMRHHGITCCPFQPALLCHRVVWHLYIQLRGICDACGKTIGSTRAWDCFIEFPFGRGNGTFPMRTVSLFFFCGLLARALRTSSPNKLNNIYNYQLGQE